MTAIASTDLETAPCLRAGPLDVSGRRFASAARSLGHSRGASVIRAWCVAHIFQQRESIFASNREPLAAFVSLLEESARLLGEISQSSFIRLGADSDGKTDVNFPNGLEAATGEYYAHLFKSFSSQSYWEEPLGLLRTRLERNGVDIASLRGKCLLDAGCGGGRYTAAWNALGAQPVIGVDISPANIGDAQRRAVAAGLDIQFQVTDVLNLPFADTYFDLVFSNGVLHHTRDCARGIRELVRVLKPGGLGWLYLIEKPGGLFWDSIEILRAVMRGERDEIARMALQILGTPSNRIFYMLDHVMVPINVRLTTGEVERYLRDAGATEIRRLNRGADFDRIERIYRGEPFAEVKYGVGEHRYTFSRR